MERAFYLCRKEKGMRSEEKLVCGGRGKTLTSSVRQSCEVNKLVT